MFNKCVISTVASLFSYADISNQICIFPCSRKSLNNIINKCIMKSVKRIYGVQKTKIEDDSNENK